MRLQSISQTVNWKKIQTKLIIDNCLTFGQDNALTPKKISRYLLGTRIKIELFKLYELRCLLLKIYPLIHNLFYNPRLNFELQTKIVQKNFYTTKRFSLIPKHKHLPPQILFATVTPAFGSILQNAAELCNMPIHKNRWLNGSITAAVSYFADKNAWNYFYDPIQKNIGHTVTQKWGANKENTERIKEKIIYYGASRWPSLLIIPDVINNEMIVREAKTVNLPIIGLVNSNCHLEIDYPIFAQDQTNQSIYFFCHFLAGLISKEMVYIQHKRFTIQKIKRQRFQTVLKHSKKQTVAKINATQIKARKINKKKKFIKNSKKIVVVGKVKASKVTVYNNKTSQKIKLKDNKKTFFFEHVQRFQAKTNIRPFFWKNFGNIFAKARKTLKFITIIKGYTPQHIIKTRLKRLRSKKWYKKKYLFIDAPIQDKKTQIRQNIEKEKKLYFNKSKPIVTQLQKLTRGEKWHVQRIQALHKQVLKHTLKPYKLQKPEFELQKLKSEIEKLKRLQAQALKEHELKLQELNEELKLPQLTWQKFLPKFLKEHYLKRQKLKLRVKFEELRLRAFRKDVQKYQNKLPQWLKEHKSALREFNKNESKLHIVEKRWKWLQLKTQKLKLKEKELKKKKRKIKEITDYYWKETQRSYRENQAQRAQLLLNTFEKRKRNVSPRLFGNFFVFLSHWTRSKSAVVLIHKEDKKKFTGLKKNYLWTLEEKKEVWQNLRNDYMIHKLTNLQRAQLQSTFKWSLGYPNNNYYWFALKHWTQDPEWQNHKFKLNRYLFALPKKSKAIKPRDYYKKKKKFRLKNKSWSSWKNQIETKWRTF